MVCPLAAVFLVDEQLAIDATSIARKMGRVIFFMIRILCVFGYLDDAHFSAIGLLGKCSFGTVVATGFQNVIARVQIVYVAGVVVVNAGWKVLRWPGVATVRV